MVLTLIKVTCPMNVHEFQCWHRSLLFHDRIGFETAALEVSFFFFNEYFSTQETHLPSSDLYGGQFPNFQLNLPHLQFIIHGDCFKVLKKETMIIVFRIIQ